MAVAFTLPPPPIRGQAGDFVWTAWQNSLYRSLSSPGSIAWTTVNKSGSNLSDLQVRPHSQLQNIQGGNATEQYHLNASQYASIGNVTGPGSSNNNTVVLFSGTSGTSIKDSGLFLSGSNTGDQTITLTGDITGTGTGSFPTTLTNTTVTVGTYGSASVVPSLTVDSKGRVTSATNNSININISQTSGILPTSRGGLGANITASAGSLLYGNGTTFTPLSAGNASQTLVSNGSNAPYWKTGLPLAAYTSITNNYTATTSDDIIEIASSVTTDKTVTLPTAVSITGKLIVLKNMGTGNVTVSGTSGQLIDTAATNIIPPSAQALRVVSNGANWLAI